MFWASHMGTECRARRSGNGFDRRHAGIASTEGNAAALGCNWPVVIWRDDREVRSKAAWSGSGFEVRILRCEVRVMPPVEYHPAGGQAAGDDILTSLDTNGQRVEGPVQQTDMRKPLEGAGITPLTKNGLHQKQTFSPVKS